jgi:hypothetical protein
MGLLTSQQHFGTLIGTSFNAKKRAMALHPVTKHLQKMKSYIALWKIAV